MTDFAEVVFLSMEPWRGPLTINLLDVDGVNTGEGHLPEVGSGEIVLFQSGNLFFSSSGLVVETQGLAGWQSIRPVCPNELRTAQQRLAEVAAWVGHTSQGGGWSNLLIDVARRERFSGEDDLAPHLQSLCQCLDAGNSEAFVQELIWFSGRGVGLTPSGDDLLAGLFLAASRYPGLCASRIDWPWVFERTIQLVCGKTTSLSARLMECASQGQADERLVLGLDGVITGKLTTAEVGRLFLAFGSSSGGDCLLGMCLAMLSQ